MNNIFIIGGFTILVAIIASVATGLIPLPLACTTHGCVWPREIQKQTIYDAAFATATQSSQPTQEATLTSVFRRHLLSFGTGVPVISKEDATRYREDVLHYTDTAELSRIGFASFDEYDTTVVVPFLKQEALMKQKNLTNVQDLYKDISGNHWIIFFDLRHKWDKNTGEVVAR